MFAKLKEKVKKRFSKYENGDSKSIPDPLLWSLDLENHYLGQFSVAAVRAHESVEDYSHVVATKDYSFFGVYDGHNGDHAARFLSVYLHDNLIEGGFTPQEIRAAVLEAENVIDGHVDTFSHSHPLRVTSGSSCLFGILEKSTLHIVNLGDSRAVVGRVLEDGTLVADQLTADDNINDPQVRDRFLTDHPDDAQLVVMRDQVFRIKDILEVTKSIGDRYMKVQGTVVHPEDPLHQQFYSTPEPINWPLISSDPSIITREIEAQDRFYIFGSRGLWELLTNQEACEFVHKRRNKQKRIAEKLVRRALIEAGRKAKRTYNQLKRMVPSARMHLHDDITAIVVFVDVEIQGRGIRGLTIKSFNEPAPHMPAALLSPSANNSPNSAEPSSSSNQPPSFSSNVPSFSSITSSVTSSSE